MRLGWTIGLPVVTLVLCSAVTIGPVLAQQQAQTPVKTTPKPATHTVAAAHPVKLAQAIKPTLAANPQVAVKPTPHPAPVAHHYAALSPPKPEVKVAQRVRPVGPGQVGTAAWYGGSYLGRRTTSGEPLDTIHSTAAHRSLPLNSLARVTNLRNGRSVIVRVTDRGPVSETLLIDVSPSAAEQLDMKLAGVVPVTVEQVVEVPPDAK
jgi:rare lipoprotein A (peptidoglycan hydrolase)